MQREPTVAAKHLAAFVDRIAMCAWLYLAFRCIAEPFLTSADTGAYLVAGDLLLSGLVPYVDFYETNPPLVLYLHALPAVLARVSPLPTPLTFNLLVLALVAASWAATRRLLAAACEPATARFVALAPVFVSLHVFTGFGEGFGFGQREHLFWLAAIPYLVLRGLRWQGQAVPARGALVLGVAAGLFGSLKPFFLVVLVAGEIAWAAGRRRLAPLLAPETAAAALMPLTYAAHFLMLPAAMWEAYFGRWLPLMVEGYAVYNAPLPALLTRPAFLSVLLVASLPLLVRPAVPGRLASHVAPWSAMAFAGALGFLIQGKGWDYHLIPALGAAIGLVLIWLSELGVTRGAQVKPLAPRLGMALAAAACVGCAALAIAQVRRGFPPPTLTPQHVAVLQFSAPGDRIFFFDTDVFPQHPLLVQLGRRPGARYYSTVFVLPMLYAGVRVSGDAGFPYRVGADQSDEERRLLRELEEDMARFQPRLVFVPRGGGQALPPGFSLSEYVEATGWAERALVGYRRIGLAGDDVVWVREASPPDA